MLERGEGREGGIEGGTLLRECSACVRESDISIMTALFMPLVTRS